MHGEFQLLCNRDMERAFCEFLTSTRNRSADEKNPTNITNYFRVTLDKVPRSNIQ